MYTPPDANAVGFDFARVDYTPPVSGVFFNTDLRYILPPPVRFTGAGEGALGVAAAAWTAVLQLFAHGSSAPVFAGEAGSTLGFDALSFGAFAGRSPLAPPHTGVAEGWVDFTPSLAFGAVRTTGSGVGVKFLRAAALGAHPVTITASGTVVVGFSASGAGRAAASGILSASILIGGSGVGTAASVGLGTAALTVLGEAGGVFIGPRVGSGTAYLPGITGTGFGATHLVVRGNASTSLSVKAQGSGAHGRVGAGTCRLRLSATARAYLGNSGASTVRVALTAQARGRFHSLLQGSAVGYISLTARGYATHPLPASEKADRRFVTIRRREVTVQATKERLYV